MNIEIINTGAELMIGRVLNTHQQWLCRQLTDHGYLVTRQLAVDDAGPAIVAAVDEALQRADLVITTGGLGPTSDDRTRDVIAELLGRKLKVDAAALANIEGFFHRRRRTPPASVKVQALVPAGAIVLQNANGTAPGIAVVGNPVAPGKHARGLIMLPGPPRELRPMFREQALPLILKEFPEENPFLCRTLKTTGLGESFLEEKIVAPMAGLVTLGLELGYCARTGEVDLRFAARGKEAATLIAEAEKVARASLGDIIFGEEDEQLEDVIVRLLTERSQTLALAESCTGGFIANRLTNVPGASAALLAGLVTYSNDAKQTFLGVQSGTLAEHGAVSEPVAHEMAEGARNRTKADYALSVTGIAGPSGGSEDKPVGTVYIGLAAADGCKVKRHLNQYDRETFKYVTSQQALEMLRRAILKTG